MALEKRSDVGGLWCYSDDPDVITVTQNTKTTSSSSVTEMSDFPMPEEIGQFPKREDVLEYLKSYCETFNLWSHIRLEHCVTDVTKEDEFWRDEVREWPTVYEQVFDRVYRKRTKAQSRPGTLDT